MRVFNVSCAEDCEPAVGDLKVPVCRFSCSDLTRLGHVEQSLIAGASATEEKRCQELKSAIADWRSSLRLRRRGVRRRVEDAGEERAIGRDPRR